MPAGALQATERYYAEITAQLRSPGFVANRFFVFRQEHVKSAPR